MLVLFLYYCFLFYGGCYIIIDLFKSYVLWSILKTKLNLQGPLKWSIRVGHNLLYDGDRLFGFEIGLQQLDKDRICRD